MPLRDAVNTAIPHRSELSFEEYAMLIEWALGKKYRGDIRERGVDESNPGSTFWHLGADIRVAIQPSEQRLWIAHTRKPGDCDARVLKFLTEVLTTHRHG